MTRRSVIHPFMCSRAVRDLTVWRRHKPLRAGLTAEEREWRWPALCCLHPEWSLQSPLQLIDTTSRLTEGKCHQGNKLNLDKCGQGRLSKRRWMPQVNKWTQTGGWKNTHTAGMRLAGRCLLTQAEQTHRGEVLSILWFVWVYKTNCVVFLAHSIRAHQHTQVDSPSKAWLPKQSWLAARHHSVSQCMKIDITLPVQFVFVTRLLWSDRSLWSPPPYTVTPPVKGSVHVWGILGNICRSWWRRNFPNPIMSRTELLTLASLK